VYLRDVYGKDAKEDLKPDEKKILKGLAKQLREEAIRATARKGKGKRNE
jgi:outer membrane protein OmpA-like peptidoglycan-associated protein